MQNNPYINNQQQNTHQLSSEQLQMQNPSKNTNPYIVNQPNAQSSNSTFDTGNFLKGALIGAIGAYLLTNEDAQKKIFKTFAKGADMFGAGIEEMKERMEDAKAELEAEREAK